MRLSKAVKRVSCIEDGGTVTLYEKKPSKRKVRRKRVKKVWKDISKGKRFF